MDNKIDGICLTKLFNGGYSITSRERPFTISDEDLAAVLVNIQKEHPEARLTIVPMEYRLIVPMDLHRSIDNDKQKLSKVLVYVG